MQTLKNVKLIIVKSQEYSDFSSYPSSAMPELAASMLKFCMIGMLEPIKNRIIKSKAIFWSRS